MPEEFCIHVVTKIIKIVTEKEGEASHIDLFGNILRKNTCISGMLPTPVLLKPLYRVRRKKTPLAAKLEVWCAVKKPPSIEGGFFAAHLELWRGRKKARYAKKP